MAVVPSAKTKACDAGSFKDVVSHEVLTVLKAAQRVAAMAVVDASVALPKAQPVWDAALRALRLQTSRGEFMEYRPSTKPSALLVLCHPSEGQSLCHRLAEIWEEELKSAGIASQRLDLGGADQTCTGLVGETELRAALAKAAPSEKVEAMQHMVEESRFLIFVHPIFWFDVPSQLKGFLESVLSSGFAFRKLPSCWTLSSAVGVLEHLPVVPSLLRRYSAYGFLRDKLVFITRTQGGPEAGPRLFGHSASSLESTVQFCGARVAAVDTIADVDDTSRKSMEEVRLPRLRSKIALHCQNMAIVAAAQTSQQEESVCMSVKMSSAAPVPEPSTEAMGG